MIELRFIRRGHYDASGWWPASQPRICGEIPEPQRSSTCATEHHAGCLVGNAGPETIVWRLLQWNLSWKTTLLAIKNMVSQDRCFLVTGSFIKLKNVGLSAPNWWSFETGGGLLWQWSLKTGFTVVVNRWIFSFFHIFRCTHRHKRLLVITYIELEKVLQSCVNFRLSSWMRKK